MTQGRTTTRQTLLRWITSFLVISLVLLGGFNAIVLSRMDSQYSSIVAQNLRLLNAIRLVTRHSAEANRSLLNYLVGDPAEREFQLARYRSARAKNDSNFSELIELTEETTLAQKVQELQRARMAYLDAADRLITLADTETREAVDRFRINRARPLFDAYLQAQDSLADEVQKETDESSRQLSRRTERWKVLSVSFGAWPLLAALVFGAALAAVLSWLSKRHDDLV